MLDIIKPSGRVVLLGNEAIVRGAIESGIGFSSSYPGTPASEVGLSLAGIAKKIGIYFEWSTNEKTAFEAASGAAYCGVRSIVAMKHFGLNVASDSIFPVVYTGVNAGMVLMAADDPNGWSSAQSEQDSRYYSRISGIPTLEPSNPQECKDFTKIAFEISEKYKIPVFLRTTTKVSHAIGTVKLGKIKNGKITGRFIKSKKQFYNIKPNLQELHKKVIEKIGKIEKEYSKLNKIEGKEKGKIGIIANGVSYEYVKELFDKKAKIGKISLSYPLSRKFISNFIKGLNRIIVVEELEPIIENFVREVAKDENPKLKIYGKDILPRIGEYNLEILYSKLGKFFKLQKPKVDFEKHTKDVKKIKVPTRKPVMCPGCPHRSTFYAVKKVLGKNAIFAGDIGCYILGIFEPYEMQDFCISMGASAGISHGIKKVSKQKVVSFIGDSTFFHAGMPAILNLKHNNSNPLVIVMDNDITAMTGHQPHPGSGFTGMGIKNVPTKIDDVVKSFGVKNENVKVVNSFNQRELQKNVEELSKKNELAVIVSRGECRLLTKRKLRKEGKSFAKFQIDQKKCKKCGICTNEFACPAIQKDENGNYFINEDMCLGCGVCAQICPAKAIKVKT